MNYENTLDQAKQAINNISDESFVKLLHSIFPGLENNDAERIRNLYEQLINGIALLQNQGNNSINDDRKILQRFAFYVYEDEPDILYLANVFVNEEYRNKGIGTKILKIADIVASSMGSRTIRLQCSKGSNAERLYKTNGYIQLPTLTENEQEIWLEKQGKQADKLVPKFKVGDWVARNYQNGSHTVNQIVEIKQLDDKTFGYKLDDKSYFSGIWTKEYHLWTIEDVKEGDVLANDTIIIIVDHLGTFENTPIIYSWYFADSKKFHGMGTSKADRWEAKGFTPATNEQYHTLISKMKEAGFKWDDNNKELIRY